MAKQYTAVLFSGSLGTSVITTQPVDVSGYKKYTIQVKSNNPNGLVSIKLSGNSSIAASFIEDAICSFGSSTYAPAFQVITNFTQIPLVSKFMRLDITKTSGTNGNVVVIGTFQE